MQTHIQKWGNSLGVRIPVALSRQLHLTHGCTVDLTIEANRLVINTKHYALDDMLRGVTKDNMHHQIPLLDDGAVGVEEW